MELLRFTRWAIDEDISMSALLPPGTPQCGIYVLESSDGTEYVGQPVALDHGLADDIFISLEERA